MEKLEIAEFIHQRQHFFVGEIGRMATSENAFRSTSRNLDFDSNLTEESDRE
jgi:hypothetical protein